MNALKSIAQVAQGDGNNLGAAILALVVIMGGIALLMLEMNKLGQTATAGDPTKGILKIAASIWIIMQAVRSVAVVAQDNLAGVGVAIGALVVTMIGIGVLMGVMSGLSKKGEISSSLGNSLLKMAGAILVIAAAVRVVGAMPTEQIVSASIALGILFAVLVGAGALLSLSGLSAGFDGFGNALLKIAAVVAIVSVALLAFAAALKLMGEYSGNAIDAGRNLAQGIVGFMDELMANADSVLGFIGSLITGIISLLVERASLIAEAILSVITTLINVFKDSNISESIIGVLAIFIADILEWLINTADSIVGAIVVLIITIVNGISKALIEQGPHLFAALGNLGLALANLIGQLLGQITNAIADFMVDVFGMREDGKVVQWLRGVSDTFAEEGEYIVGVIDEENAMLKESGSGYADEIRAFGENILGASEESAASVSSGVSQLNAAVAELGTGSDDQRAEQLMEQRYSRIAGVTETGVNAVATSIDTGKETVSTAASGFGSGILTEMFNSFQSGDMTAEQLGAYLPEGLSVGMLDSANLPTDAAGNVSEQTMSEFLTQLGINSPSRITQEMGMNLDAGLALGIGSNIGLVNSPISSLVSACLRGLDNLRAKFYDAGGNADKGLANGISAYSSVAVNAAYVLAQQVSNTLKNALKIKSPSKVTEEFGKFFDLGFSKGIDGYAGTVDDSVTSMSDQALNGIRDVVKRINDALDGDFDSNPMIRPVLDLTEIQNGSYLVGSMLSGYSLTPELSGVARAASIMGGSVNVEGEDLARSFQGMRDDIVSSMNEHTRVMREVKVLLANQKIYLDGDKVIGSVNEGLARSSMRRR